VTTVSKTVNERTTLTFTSIPITKNTLKSGDCIAFEMVGSHWPSDWTPFKFVSAISVSYETFIPLLDDFDLSRNWISKAGVFPDDHASR